MINLTLIIHRADGTRYGFTKSVSICDILSDFRKYQDAVRIEYSSPDEGEGAIDLCFDRAQFKSEFVRS